MLYLLYMYTGMHVSVASPWDRPQGTQGDVSTYPVKP